MISRRAFGAGLCSLVVQAIPPRRRAEGVVAQPLPSWSTSRTDGFRLVKDWDFRTLIRDKRALYDEFYSRYKPSGGKLDHLNDEWSRYRDNDNHVFTSEGLALVARRVGEFAPGQIESGMLRSRWTGKYGRIEIRMRAPGGRGMWPAFWLACEDQKWPPEIDVVEIVNNGRDTTKQSFHFLHGAGMAKSKPTLSRLNARSQYVPGPDYSDGFHDFGVDWSEEKIRHYVDGALVIERPFRWIHDDGSDAGDAHVLANLAVGGKWPGPPDERALPASMTIQHIRVWQR